MSCIWLCLHATAFFVRMVNKMVSSEEHEPINLLNE
jgi:hypothetical protein